MFLFPAAGSAACDALVLYINVLGRTEESRGQERRQLQSLRVLGDDLYLGEAGVGLGVEGDHGDNDAENDNDSGWFDLESSQYLTALAALRLTLLFLPLTYHTFNGTRIKFSYAYFILYGATYALILCHMLAIAMLDPRSFGSLLFVPPPAVGGDWGSGQGPEEEVAGDWGGDQWDDRGRWLSTLGNGSASSSSASSSAWRDALDAAVARYLYSTSLTSLSSSPIHAASMRRVWLTLALSFVSTTLHVVLLLHVKSSAPGYADVDRRKGKRRKKMLAYYAYARFRRGRESSGRGGDGVEGVVVIDGERAHVSEDHLLGGEFGDGTAVGKTESDERWCRGRTDARSSLLTDEERPCYDSGSSSDGSVQGGGDGDGDADEDEDDEEEGDPFLETNGRPNVGARGDRRRSAEIVAHDDDDGGAGGRKGPRMSRIFQRGQRVSGGSLRSLIPDGYEEFMVELESRLEEAKRVWSVRLKDFTHRIQDQIPTAARDRPLLGALHLTPFRALLQLYAYEEVLSNRKLDRAFGGRAGDDALAFYAPQLLSFLLHGAFLNTSELERWILDRCRVNLRFAHRCFWFLRAWCLGKGSHSHDDKLELGVWKEKRRISLGAVNGDEEGIDVDLDRGGRRGGTITDLLMRTGSEANLYKVASPLALSHKRSNSSGALGVESPSKSGAATSQEARSSKFPQEEHVVIEELLFEVAQCGEVAAIALQNRQFAEDNYGTSDASKTWSTQENLDLVNAGLLPVDPETGNPSESHIKALKSIGRHGSFMNPRLLANVPQSAPKNGTGQFLLAPRFLDALTSVADDLMLIQPKSHRTAELRRRLRALEVELLPSSVIYAPVSGGRHQVWRILADESVALSTNERVPCIVTLEVIEFDDENGEEKSIDTKRSDGVRPRRSQSSGAVSQSARGQGLRSRFSDLSNSKGVKLGKGVTAGNSLGSKSEREILKAWCQTPRLPKRHNTLVDTTLKGLRKLRDDIEDTIQVSNERIFRGVQVGNGWREIMPHIGNDSLYRDDNSQGVGGIVVQNGDGKGLQTPQVDTTSSPEGKATARSDTASLNNNNNMISTLSDPPLIASPEKLPYAQTEYHYQVPIFRDATANNGSRHGLIGPTSLASSSPTSSRPPSPTTAMGQWSSPKQTCTARRLEHKLHGALHVDNDLFLVDLKCDNKLHPDDEILEGFAEATRESNAMPVASGEESSKPKKRRLPPVVFKEDWAEKQERLRSRSAIGSHPKWRLLPVLIKSNDDLRQEQLASQLIYRMASILARGRVPVWLYPYEILALTDRGGIIEAIPDTISIDSLKRNDPNYVNLKTFFEQHFGPAGCDEFANARANFVESLAGYSIVCFLLQIKDRHNGNILLTSRGHLVHIDFGFFFLSSPGRNSGFESAPFKLTRDFVDLMGGPESRTFSKFRDLCFKAFLELRKHCYEITLLVEMLMEGNEDLQCFRGRPEEAVEGLRRRFRLDLNDRACIEYVNSLVNESLENWRTRWYDRYQRFCVGVL